MLSLNGYANRLCDGLTRREILKVGALGMGGLSLPNLLRAEQARGILKSQKAVIMIYMVGAPPHQDMYDLKMEAPVDIRGEFKPINSKVPGIQICEYLPKIASIMDKCVPIRSVYGSPDGDHDSFICYTGRSKRDLVPGTWPSIGSTISKLLGPANGSIPPFVGLAPNAGHPPYGSPGHPGYLGVTHSAFRPSGSVREDMKLNGLNSSMLADRKQLLANFDGMRRDLDNTQTMNGLDAFGRQAMEILSSAKLAEALDISKEPQAIRDRYGKGDSKNYGDGAPRNPDHFLMARRLVEAGARVVTLNFGRWDFHSKNFSECKDTHFPIFDRCMHALITDLHERGMDKDVAVVAWGEFGRTPKINADGGRDHWPDVGGALIAGGGFKTGQVIGSTTKDGGRIASRPVHFGEVHATLYHHFGIDPLAVTLPDYTGRPHTLVDNWRAMPELV
ncbi:DUF1501 domain-containing protein [Telmatocola sphagniphila]|uniref:DUF1501 domain-containing protein n=1 Tax=Telmatocola sphagniphila TaxID=1123043 RepID=A0A8E6EXY9_9BACT|nr:DUF1501 domain-containing protein [Telmatocola sphagniphila]QVL32138.1 DUF1501 domain-containing protein [Telmatocola sphagniphila]